MDKAEKVLEAIKETEGIDGTTIETISEEAELEMEEVRETVEKLREGLKVYEPIEGRFKYLG